MTQLRVLVVDDDPSARGLLVAILEGEGFNVCAVPDGRTALEAAESYRPDLVLLDERMPGIGGGAVARRLRQTSDIPIIFVTAADSASEIHEGFRTGADDYIVKPFDSEELSWRVRAVLRRTGRPVAEVRQCGDLVVDEGTHSVTIAGSSVPVTALEFKLVLALIRNRKRVVPKIQLVRQVWGYDADDHVLEVHISSLRRKLEVNAPRMVHTVRGAGYILRPVTMTPLPTGRHESVPDSAGRRHQTSDRRTGDRRSRTDQ